MGNTANLIDDVMSCDFVKLVLRNLNDCRVYSASPVATINSDSKVINFDSELEFVTRTLILFNLVHFKECPYINLASLVVKTKIKVSLL